MPTLRTPRASKPTSKALARRAPKAAGAARAQGDIDSIITLDDSGTIQSASADIEALLGWAPAELLGRNVKLLIPEPRRTALDRYLDRYRDPGRSRVLERARRFDGVAKDGTFVPIELSVSRADLPGHDGPYFVGLVRDMRGRIDVDSDTHETRSRLQRFVTEQTRALAEAHLRLQLSDRLVSLGTLAAGLGHDLNNVLLPLRVRLNAAEHAGVTPAALTHLAEVRLAVTYLQHLSDGLHVLAIDPAAAGDPIEAEAPTDLAAWWGAVGVLLRTAVPRRVALSASFAKGLPRVAIGPNLLTQAVMNIIVNAGEAVAHRAKSGRITLSGRFEPGRKLLRLSISDNGPGMTEVVQRRAFDPFFTTKPRTVGTGLGLPISRKAIERSGGRIEIGSGRGKGTTIALLLPIAGNAATAAPCHGPRALLAAATLPGRKTELLVLQMLSAAGFAIVAENGGTIGQAALWVTAPSAAALHLAQRWLTRDPQRSIILLGKPEPKSRRAWAALRTVFVDDSKDLRSLREAITQAAGLRLNRERATP